MERLKWRILTSFKKFPTESCVEDLTDGQWLYLIINTILDDEEEFNKLCDSCKIKSKEAKCMGCGKSKVMEINPNFDINKFEEMKKRSGGGNNGK